MLSLIVLLACAEKGGDSAQPGGGSSLTADELARVSLLSPLPAIPDDPTNAYADDPAAAHLGRFLYFEERFSENGAVSCATCHDPDAGFADGLTLSEGVSTAGAHAPSIWNTAYNRWFFWDGRCDSHWCQALGPLEDAAEMGSSRLEIAHLLDSDADLRAGYEAVFGALPDLSDGSRFPAEGRPVAGDPDHPHALAWGGMTAEDQATIDLVFANVGKAIAAYERQVVSPASAFDSYATALLADQPTSGLLSEEAERGLKLFVGGANCHLCHIGPNFTNNEFHNIGLGPRDWLDSDDLGRYDGISEVLSNPFNGQGAYSDAPEDAAIQLGFLVQSPEQLGQYKVPSLRNVALTAPYMHGGHFATLEDVVAYYDELGEEPLWGHREEILVPLELSEQDRADLVAFLESLTAADIDPALASPPASPIP